MTLSAPATFFPHQPPHSQGLPSEGNLQHSKCTPKPTEGNNSTFQALDIWLMKFAPRCSALHIGLINGVFCVEHPCIDRLPCAVSPWRPGAAHFPESLTICIHSEGMLFRFSKDAIHLSVTNVRVSFSSPVPLPLCTCFLFPSRSGYASPQNPTQQL